MKRLIIGIALLLLLLLGVGTVLAQGGGIDLTTLPGMGWYVAWQVQNVSPTDIAHITVLALKAEGSTVGGTHGATEEIAPGAGITFIPGKLNALSPPLPDGFIGSAVVSADQPIVAIGFVTNQLYPGGGLGVDGGKASAAYQGISGENAGPKVNFPLVKLNWFGQSTTFYVQAAGSAVEVTMRYRMNDGTEVTDGPYALDADEMKVFAPQDVLGSPACGEDAETTPCLGGAVAEATGGDIVGIFTEHPHAADPATFVNATRGFGPGDAGTTLAAPIIKNDFFGNTTGLTVQNATDSQVQVNVTFKGALYDGAGDASQCVGQTFSGTEVSLASGKSYVYFPGLNNMGGFPEGCYGSATVTANGDIVATVTEFNPATKQQTIYAAFSVANATRKVAVPLVKEDWVGATTGIAIQNVGDSPTSVTCTYNVVQGTNPGSVTLAPQTIPPRGSIALYRVWRDPGTYGTDAPKLEKSYSAAICESDSENIVAVVQEADLNGEIDLNNYEGFNLQ